MEKDVLDIKNELSLIREERRKERIISKIDQLARARSEVQPRPYVKPEPPKKRGF